MYEASIPSILSSTIILFPASPNVFFTKIVSIAEIASVSLLHTITPFPAANPSALTTTLKSMDWTYSIAFWASSNISNCAVGILFLFIKFFAQILLDSSCAAAWEGPKTFRFNLLNLSTMPEANGSSGPTTVKQLFFCANSANPSKSLTSSSTLFSVPPFPGAV